MTTSPNEVAQALIGRPYLSHSSLSTYRTCPLRFNFRYVSGLPEEFVSSSLAFGSAIHAALERFFVDQFEGLQTPSVDDMIEAYRASWLSRDIRQVRFRDNESLESLLDLAKRMFTAFVASPAANVEGRLLGVEEEISRSLLPDCPDLLARIDLLIDTEDGLLIRDFKTSRAKWSAEQLEAEAAQLLLYHEVVQELADGKPVRLEYVVLTKTKVPAVDVHKIEFDSERLRWHTEAVRSVWQGVQNEVFFPSPSMMACSTCSYKSACRRWCGVDHLNRKDRNGKEVVGAVGGQ